MATDYTVDNVIDTLADFIEGLNLGACEQAQANRVPMSLGQFNIITPLRFKRLGTTRDIKGDSIRKDYLINVIKGIVED